MNGLRTANLVNKLRQICPLARLSWRFYGAFMLEWLATVRHYVCVNDPAIHAR